MSPLIRHRQKAACLNRSCFMLIQRGVRHRFPRRYAWVRVAEFRKISRANQSPFLVQSDPFLNVFDALLEPVVEESQSKESSYCTQHIEDDTCVGRAAL